MRSQPGGGAVLACRNNSGRKSTPQAKHWPPSSLTVQICTCTQTFTGKLRRAVLHAAMVLHQCCTPPHVLVMHTHALALSLPLLAAALNHHGCYKTPQSDADKRWQWSGDRVVFHTVVYGCVRCCVCPHVGDCYRGASALRFTLLCNCKGTFI